MTNEAQPENQQQQQVQPLQPQRSQPPQSQQHQPQHSQQHQAQQQPNQPQQYQPQQYQPHQYQPQQYQPLPYQPLQLQFQLPAPPPHQLQQQLQQQPPIYMEFAEPLEGLPPARAHFDDEFEENAWGGQQADDSQLFDWVDRQHPLEQPRAVLEQPEPKRSQPIPWIYVEMFSFRPPVRGPKTDHWTGFPWKK